MPLRHHLPVYSPIALGGALRSARRAIYGGADPRPRVAALLARGYAADDVVLCGSGTQALQLALRLALGSAGDNALVALPGYGCFDLLSAAVGADARLTFYDLDPETLAPDPESLERALDQGARVAVVAPLFGLPVNWEALESHAARVGALLIEDAAQGHGASWRGRLLGSLGRLSVLSFGRGKGWTGGRGGALLLRGEPLASAGVPRLGEPTRREELSSAAVALAQWLLGRPSLYGVPASLPGLGLGQTLYHEPAEPHRMGAAAATLLERSRAAAERAAAERRGAARRLLGEMPPGLDPIRPHPDGTPGYLRLPLRLARGMESFASPEHALRLGVAPGYPATLAALPQARQRLAGASPPLPGAETLVRELVTLPTHAQLTAAEQSELLRLLDSCAAPRRTDARRSGAGTCIAS